MQIQINRNPWQVAITYPKSRKALGYLGEKAITSAMMLVTPHLINAWIFKPLLKSHIYLISHYSPDRVQAFKVFHYFPKLQKFSMSWKCAGKCHLNDNLYIKHCIKESMAF